MQKITILIPVYNEINTLEEVLQKIEEIDFFGLEKELILVDDFSTDGTKEILYKLEDKYKVFYHDKNMGKGAALRTGFEHVTGDIVLIQDADLEYNPIDYIPLVKSILDDEADVVYGSRLLDYNPSSFMWTHLLANKLITFTGNILYNLKLTDIETCYKAFKAKILDGIKIKSNRFDFEPEITAKILKKGARLKELPISYSGRTYLEGKKVTWIDGFHAIWALVKFKFVD